MSAPDVAAELQKLAEEVEGCTRCDLHCNTTHGVPGEGPASATIMFVGEGPGRNEDMQGRPFVGAAGKFLAELLAAAGLKREEVYITNVVKHRPTRRDASGTVQNRAPTPDEIAACRVYLDRQLELIKPRLVVTLGAHSLGTFFPGQGITRSHGQIRERDGRFYFHSFHPAAALYKEDLRDTMLDDMRKLGQFLQSPAYTDRGASPPEKAAEEAPEPDDEHDEPEQLSLL